MITLLKISEIKRTTEMQPRTTINMAVAEDYAEDIKNGAKFPPLTVFHVGDEYVLVDGFHRILGAQSAGLKKVSCEVLEGTIRDAFLHASGVNSGHGLRRTNEDKRRAVERLLVDPEWSQWSDNKIAEICNVSVPFVGKHRNVTININSEVGETHQKTRLYATKHGTTSKMDVSKIGKKITSPFQPPTNSIPVTDAEPIKSVGELSREKENPSNSTGLEPPKPKPLPCSYGPCQYFIKKAKDSIKGDICDAIGVEIHQISECYFDKHPEKSREAIRGSLLFQTAGINKPPQSTQELPKITKYPLITNKDEMHKATARFIDDCLTDRYHRLIWDAKTTHMIPTDLDVICKALDLLSEWEGDTP